MSERDLESLTRSITEFGLVDPIVARREDKKVIGGHQRLRAALKLGMPLVPVVFIEMSEEKSKLLNIALNQISGEFDTEMLARLLSDLELSTEDLDLTISGLDDDDLSTLLGSLKTREKRQRPESFDFAVALEATKASSRVSVGELWTLGDHKLLVGDATDSADVEKVLEGQPADLLFTDPPYNVDYEKAGKKIKNDSLSESEWAAFTDSWIGAFSGLIKGAMYICMSSKELPTLCNTLGDAGFHWSTTIIWSKDNFTLGRSDYQRGYEPIWYGWPEDEKHFWCGDRDQSDVWTIQKPSRSPLHPTMKPIELVERAVENGSAPGATVLDVFTGSGSTLIACERTGRTFRGIEIDPIYAEAAIARWEAFTGSTATKE